MKLERIRSNWNELDSQEQYHIIPSEEQVIIALNNGYIKLENTIICAKENLVEVKSYLENGVAGNRYRDLYRIV